MPKLKYAVIGTGAMGGVIGGHLLKADCDVHFLARSDFDQLSSHGLQLEIIHSDREAESLHFHPITVYKNIDAMPACDVVLLATKHYDNVEILPRLKAILMPNTVIILLHNGIDIENSVAEKYANRIMATVSWIKATRTAPAKYRHDFGETIQVAMYLHDSQSFTTELTTEEQNILSDFQRGGITLRLENNLPRMQWTKLALNLPLFALSIKYNLSSHEILVNPSYAKELADLKLEIEKTSLSYGYNIDSSLIDSTYFQLKNANIPTYPSMKIDFDNHQKLELDATFGNVIKLANAKGIQVPLLKSINDFLQA